MDSLNELPVNALDAVVVVILLFSAFFAYTRGFVHEVLSVAGWVGAIFATFYGVPYLKPYFRQYITMDLGTGSNELAAGFAAGVVIFVVSLILFSYMTRSISNLVQDSALNALDRALGFLFGLLRGAVVVCIAYIGLELLVPQKEHPEWVKAARSMELIKPGSQALVALLPDETTRNKLSGAAQTAGERTKELLGATDALTGIISPKPKGEEEQETEGAYGSKERQDMERLIDSNQDRN